MTLVQYFSPFPALQPVGRISRLQILRLALHRCPAVMRSSGQCTQVHHLFPSRKKVKGILSPALTTMAVISPRYMPLHHQKALLYSSDILPSTEAGISTLPQIHSNRIGFKESLLRYTQAFHNRPSMQPGCPQGDVRRQRSDALDA